MYEVIWTPTAAKKLQSTLSYWIARNKSTNYATKILDEVDRVVSKIKKEPLFLVNYIEHIALYRRVFFKGRFALYYEIQNDKIFVAYFRSMRQLPL